jgi:hypothetical protein
MNKLSQKIIEAGLVPKHTLQLMKMWGMVPDDAEETDLPKNGEGLQEMAEELVADIAELVAAEKDLPELRETKIDADELWKKFVVPVRLWKEPIMSQAALDIPSEPNTAIFSRDVHIGTYFTYKGVKYTVTDVEISYRGSLPKYWICKTTTDA